MPGAIAYATCAAATGQFDPSRIVGRGGFGPVYRGELRGQSVAIKVLEAGGGQGITEFQREVRVLSACQHENIVPLVAFSMEPNKPLCLVYPLMSGGALSDALRETGHHMSLGAAARVRIAADVASGLRYLHAAGAGKPCVVHRDVKSANILLDADSRARLGDVGLARDVGAATTMTRGFALGSPGYLDPEYNETLELTAGSDVFSFGVVLLELLTSSPAIDVAMRPPTLFARLRRGLPDDAADVADAVFADASDVATQLAVLAKRSIASTSDARPTAAELAVTLDALHAEVSQSLSQSFSQSLSLARDASPMPPSRARECLICLAKPRETRLNPCHHSVVCEECASGLLARANARCPVCRVPLASFETGAFDSTYAPPRPPPPPPSSPRTLDSPFRPPPPLPSVSHAQDATSRAQDAASRGDFSELIQLVRSGTAGCKEQATLALFNFTERVSHQKAMTEAGAVAPLIELVRSGTAGGKEQAARVIARLAYSRGEPTATQHSIVAAGALAPLVQLLRSGTAGGKKNAAYALHSLAANNDANRVLIAAAGAVAPLIQLLRSDTDGGEEQAAAALANIARNIASSQVSIAAAGAVAPLIQLLRSGTANGQRNAAGALGMLSNNESNKVSIVAAGALAPLVQLLRSGTDDGKRQAAEALAYLAVNANNRFLIASAGAVAPIVALLWNGTAEGKRYAAAACWNLTTDNTANQVSITSAGAIEPLVEILRSGTDGGRHCAAAALQLLAADNANNQVSVASAGAVVPLVELLWSGTDGGKQKAAAALMMLAENPTNKVSIASAGAIAPLVELLGNGSTSGKQWAASALACLAKNNSNNNASIAAAGAAAPLVELLRSGTATCKQHAMQTLDFLIRLKEGRRMTAVALRMDAYSSEIAVSDAIERLGW